MNDAGMTLSVKLNSLGRAGSAAFRVALLVSLVGLAGCSLFGKQEAADVPDVPAGELYNQGLFLMQEGKLRQAVKQFDEVDQQHPYTEWARKALIMSAFTNYRLARYDDCIESA
jgi:outer membrane protein assembly factor BamD